MSSSSSVALPPSYTAPPVPAMKWEDVFLQHPVTRVEDDQLVMRNGELSQYLVLLLDGSIRVQKLARSGHEIVLYHLRAGQICDLAAACLLAEREYPADAIAEITSAVIMLPRAQFFHSLNTVPAFREHIYHRVSFGVTRLVNLLEEVAFGSMDGRLAQRLLTFAQSARIVRTTHQQLAVELGTAREVVSRLLKSFERRGWITLQRGSIEINEVGALREIATGG